MFAFGLKKTQVWLRMVFFLLLCFSICPHSCYPHAQEDEIPTDDAEADLKNEEDEEMAHDDDEDWKQDEEGLMEATDVENAENSKNCIQPEAPCGPDKNPQGLECCMDEGDFFECKHWFGDFKICSRMSKEQQKGQTKSARPPPRR